MAADKDQRAAWAEKQARLRRKREEAGLTRFELWLPRQAIENERFIREKTDADRVRDVICWVLDQERARVEKYELEQTRLREERERLRLERSALRKEARR